MYNNQLVYTEMLGYAWKHEKHIVLSGIYETYNKKLEIQIIQGFTKASNW